MARGASLTDFADKIGVDAASLVQMLFALGEMVVVLSRLLANHRVDVPAGWRRPAAETKVAVHPRGGMPLLLTRVVGAAHG